MNYFTWNFFYGICKEKEDEEIRYAKTKKACNSLFKAFYFITVSIWGYSILKDEPYLPKWLLGHGDLANMHADYPRVQWPKGLKIYYLGTMGYHVH